MNGLLSWMHDDITWCIEDKCPMTDCRRNPINIMEMTGLHSFANFKGTSECPASSGLDKCLDGCLYAKECFSRNDNPDDALAELTEEYCEYCMFSSMEED